MLCCFEHKQSQTDQSNLSSLLLTFCYHGVTVPQTHPKCLVVTTGDAIHYESQIVRSQNQTHRVCCSDIQLWVYQRAIPAQTQHTYLHHYPHTTLYSVCSVADYAISAHHPTPKLRPGQAQTVSTITLLLTE